MKNYKPHILIYCFIVIPVLGLSQNKAYDIEVPFAVIEKPPIYPGCEKLTEISQLKRCFSEKIANHVNTKFNVNTIVEKKERIHIIFKIDETGKPRDIRARASNRLLEAQAILIIKQLPKITPGYQRGKPVIVPYALPITLMPSPVNQTTKASIQKEEKRKAVNTKKKKKGTHNIKKEKDTTHSGLRKLFKLN